MEFENQYARTDTSKLARTLETLVVDQRDVGAHVSIFGDVPLVVVANLDLEILGRDVIQKLFGLLVVTIDDSNDLEQLVKRNCSE